MHFTFDDKSLGDLKLLKQRLSATGAHYSYSSVVRVALDAYVKSTNPQQP